MLHAGLDLSRTRLDFDLRDADGALVEAGATTPDAAGLARLVQRVARYGQPVHAAIESMTGARFVHDQLELLGWTVAIADALKVKGLAPWRARPIASTRACWRSCRGGPWSPRSGSLIRPCARSASGHASGCTW
jgi:hypothetical protein